MKVSLKAIVPSNGEHGLLLSVATLKLPDVPAKSGFRGCPRGNVVPTNRSNICCTMRIPTYIALLVGPLLRPPKYFASL